MGSHMIIDDNNAQELGWDQLDIMDYNFFNSHTMFDKKLQSDLVEIFISQSTECVEKMQKAINDKNDNLWSKTAHMFRGSALDMGMPKLAHLLHLAETSGSPNIHTLYKIMNVLHESHAKARFFITSNNAQT